MMSHPYRLDPEATQVLGTAAKLGAEVLARWAPEVDAAGRFPRESIEAIADAGLLGLTVPAALGGQGLGMRAFAGVAEELASACGSTAMIYVMHVAAAQAIASGGQ